MYEDQQVGSGNNSRLLNICNCQQRYMTPISFSSAYGLPLTVYHPIMPRADLPAGSVAGLIPFIPLRFEPYAVRPYILLVKC
jgi:hypothetical protein